MSIDTQVPSQLYSLQKWFGRLISLPIGNIDSYGLPKVDRKLAKEALLHITDGPKLKAHQRVAIYNQQYWFRLINTMQDIFPLVVRLFGFEEFNRAIAEPYLMKYPPTHWSLTELGKYLPKWIEEHYHKEDKKLILQAASIDEAYDRLFFAGSYPVIEKMDESKMEKLLYLQPHIAIFSLNGDLFSYRDLFLEHKVEYWLDNPFPTLKWGEENYFILYRSRAGIDFEKISKEEYHLLKSFEKGASLEKAFNDLLDMNENIEEKIQVWFYNWVSKGFLSFG